MMNYFPQPPHYLTMAGSIPRVPSLAHYIHLGGNHKSCTDSIAFSLFDPQFTLVSISLEYPLSS
ncbi:hypothetical protein HBI56_227050 [Parastagonospora nodorum]|uniref:Uncharacterized protein n=1 Tax=Phaeosphaeria nodorum (strain SN15 / ATCC MYA-4574 / FGSC 10173) TaxID=321614 RepID=A0A7U2EZ29_PHANO|nr:hypothetical protein HBH56_244780 [Parastagonospora nodorum]QRC95695.1 hypothetical protein JI435_407820 [Parastagonospora nodorum SN15]KAH3921058.1 hypothetical protein HBH54_246580 [Parastagonospora nodorum]KAH3939552.1 hypothetical protein HBH53_234100 [Parastagonospora nodorum]KAH3959017.1 hypothetical protein HBH51_202360 [Parastagonospora nodorum]